MDGLINIYQFLREQLIIPFIIAMLFFIPIFIQKKKKGKIKLSALTLWGLAGVVWFVFAAYNSIFRQQPFTAINEIIYIGIPLLVFTINAIIFGTFDRLKNN